MHHYSITAWRYCMYREITVCVRSAVARDYLIKTVRAQRLVYRSTSTVLAVLLCCLPHVEVTSILYVRRLNLSLLAPPGVLLYDLTHPITVTHRAQVKDPLWLHVFGYPFEVIGVTVQVSINTRQRIVRLHQTDGGRPR